jgi:hypothetical protein
MASKKSGWIVNPNTTLLRNDKTYKGGAVVEDMSDEEMAALPFGTLIPATGTEISDRLAAEQKSKIDAAKARLEVAQAELAEIEKAEADRVSTFEKDTESAKLRIELAQQMVHEAEQASVKATAEAKPAPAPPPAPEKGGKK